MKKLLGAVLHLWSESEESTFQNKNITNLTSSGTSQIILQDQIQSDSFTNMGLFKEVVAGSRIRASRYATYARWLIR